MKRILSEQEQVAADKCHAFTARTGREYAIALNPVTWEVVAEVEGDGEKVSFGEEKKDMSGLVVVHSHPHCTALSIPDLHAVTIDGLHSVVAIAADRGLYRSAGITSVFHESNAGPERMDQLERAADHVAIFLAQKKHWNYDDVATVHGHFFNLLAASEGLLDYHYSEGPYTKDKMDELIHVLERLNDGKGKQIADKVRAARHHTSQ